MLQLSLLQFEHILGQSRNMQKSILKNIMSQEFGLLFSYLVGKISQHMYHLPTHHYPGLFFSDVGVCLRRMSAVNEATQFHSLKYP